MIETLQSLDKAFFLFLNAFHFEWMNPIMQILSGQLIWVPFIGYFLWLSHQHLGKRQTFYFALFLLLAVIASDVTSSYVIKNLTERLRPCRELDLKPLIYSFGQKCGGRFGFVSSHAANSFAIVIFSLRALKFKKTLMFAFLLAPLLVSYSRIYLGVHYPGDILGGVVVGTIWATFFSWAFLRLQGAKRESFQLA